MTQTFGGKWTDEKLEVMRRYFSAYAQALKYQPFSKWYIDAFAGTGDRATVKTPDRQEDTLFGDDKSDFVEVKEGSVRIALGINPPFEKYVFVEQSAEYVVALEALQAEFPTRQIDIRSGDANQILKDLARTTDWQNIRAAMFIDPYGMQVDWSTLQALAATKAVDIALLFPTGPLNRMLTRDGNIPPEWQMRIDNHLGPCNWRDAAYQELQMSDLFSGQSSSMRKTINTDGLRRFVYERLKSIFPYVCETQLELKNSKGAVLYHLFIICANPLNAAGNLAMRLARSAMKPPST